MTNTKPGANRGPHAGSSHGVVVATGSYLQLELAGPDVGRYVELLTRSLTLPVLYSSTHSSLLTPLKLFAGIAGETEGFSEWRERIAGGRSGLNRLSHIGYYPSRF